MIRDFTSCLLFQIFIVLYTCIALQMVAGLNAILNSGLSIPIKADSLPLLICTPTTNSICDTQLFQPVTGNTPWTSNFGIFDRHTKMICFFRNKQPVRASFVCIEVLTQPTSSSLFLSLEERIDRIQKCRRVTENTPILPTEVLFAATSDCHPRHPTKDGRATDSCFALIA